MKTSKIKYEIKSAITTFIAWMITESFWDLSVFYGDFSAEAFKGLSNVLIRATIKTMIVLALPKLKTLLNANSEVDLTDSTNEK